MTTSLAWDELKVQWCHPITLPASGEHPERTHPPAISDVALYDEMIAMARKAEPDLTPEEAYREIERHQFLQNDLYGWIDRQGRWWGCGYAAHGFFSTFVCGSPTDGLETLGWVRLSDWPKMVYRPNAAQQRVCKDKGHPLRPAELIVYRPLPEPEHVQS